MHNDPRCELHYSMNWRLRAGITPAQFEMDALRLDVMRNRSLHRAAAPKGGMFQLSADAKRSFALLRKAAAALVISAIPRLRSKVLGP